MRLEQQIPRTYSIPHSFRNIPDNHCSHGGVVLQDETVQDETVCRPGDSLATLNDYFVALNAFMQIS